MTAEEHLKSGDLAATLDALQTQVRARASDPKLRIFLFQLLCVLGDWKRAITQLKLCGELDAMAVPMAQTYREGIICEVYREKVFSGDKEPLIFGEPQAWTALLVEALKLQAGGNTAAAAALRTQAFEAAPALGGELNGTRFDWIADADMRLGPMLEVVVNGKYFWMPFSVISLLEAEPPEDLRDTVWTPVTITLQNGGNIVALIPTRYAGTASQDKDGLKLARATDWRDLGEDTFAGLGQRLLATDAGDTALMDLRSLKMDPLTGADASGGDSVGNG
jgi:type VI secretion system protein ImpE